VEGFSLVDIYSTKGIEYLIAAVFFFGFLALQRNIFGQIPRRVFFIFIINRLYGRGAPLITRRSILPSSPAGKLFRFPATGPVTSL
jgi:hypothetical protein